MDYVTAGDPFFYFLTASALLKYWAFRGWSNSRPKQARLVGKVTGLRIHPVKSMKGFHVDKLQCGYDAPKSGEVADREWMVTTTENGVCGALTAKLAPRLNLITTRVDGNYLILTAQGMDDLQLPIGDTAGPVVTSKILGQSIQGADCGDHAANWVKTFLGKPLETNYRFIHFVSSLKKGDLVYGPSRLKQTVKAEDKIIYQDESPVYLVTEASLQEVNDRAKKDFTMENFRPNIVVGESSKAYDEDFWEEIFIGEVKFTNYLPCDRCAKTLVDQKQGVMVKDGEPLTTMRK